MKRKVLAGLVTTILMLVMTVTPAFAAPVITYPADATTAWGQNGGGDFNELKLIFSGDGVPSDLDSSILASIATVEVGFEINALWKPQFIVNSEDFNWDQIAVEYTDPGKYVYVHDAVGKFSADMGYNNFVIQSGWKDEGEIVVHYVVLKDADGNALYTYGDYTEDFLSDEAEDIVVAEPAKEEKVDKPAEAVPKTGVESLALIYGLGALASSMVVLKKRQK